MGHRRFHADDFEVLRFDALAAPLAEIKRRSGQACDEDRHRAMLHNGGWAHANGAAAHRGKVALLVLQLEFSVGQAA